MTQDTERVRECPECNPATDCIHFNGHVLRLDLGSSLDHSKWVWLVDDSTKPGIVIYHGPSERDAIAAFREAEQQLIRGREHD